ncbi:hypothetical protein CPS_3308 [Colwellia psychrerythraea 34H]|uniref:Uncharacterized protein n=1 Tax=Colwellia psychrerythraea (strain 34H / ATCC BAA-681) TaxID=167879 RepID=Q47YY6_COLP3|nr:hypothetical protein CPS_3308 [Colwellia psychrerythraea 34H]
MIKENFIEIFFISTVFLNNSTSIAARSIKKIYSLQDSKTHCSPPVACHCSIARLVWIYFATHNKITNLTKVI